MQGLIPADGEVWRVRRRAILPSLHKTYIRAMVDMFGQSGLHGCSKLEEAASRGESVEMEDFFSRLALDIIGKAVFNYKFDSLTKNDPVIKAGPVPVSPSHLHCTDDRHTHDRPPLRYTCGGTASAPLVPQAVYCALREAEFRSLAIFPYWNIPGIRHVLPAQQAVYESLEIINATLDELIAKCKQARPQSALPGSVRVRPRAPGGSGA